MELPEVNADEHIQVLWTYYCLTFTSLYTYEERERSCGGTGNNRGERKISCKEQHQASSKHWNVNAPGTNTEENTALGESTNTVF